MGKPTSSSETSSIEEKENKDVKLAVYGLVTFYGPPLDAKFEELAKRANAGEDIHIYLGCTDKVIWNQLHGNANWIAIKANVLTKLWMVNEIPGSRQLQTVKEYAEKDGWHTALELFQK